MRGSRKENVRKQVAQIGEGTVLALYLRVREARKVVAEFNALRKKLGNYSEEVIREIVKSHGLLD